jgi:UDP-N-acetylglucosamine/UDP-N-acetylgalactosamine 4-epimerase
VTPAGPDASRWDAVKGELRQDRRRWLVTGAAGFIGSALVEELLRLGQVVVGLDNFSTGKRANLDDVAATAGPAAAARFRFVEGDILDLETCRAACTGVDYVLHQAALGSVPRSVRDPIASHRANVDGFLDILVAARDAGVRRVVYASSSSVYGDHPALPKIEGQIGKPLSPYAATKRVDEIYAAMVQDVYGLETIGLRYFNVFGRRQDPEGVYSAVIPRWIARLLAGQRCEIFGDGKQSRDFCYIDNAVQANLLAATAPESGPGTEPVTNTVYNVGCNERTSLVELHAMIRDAIAERHPAAGQLEPSFEPPRAGDVAHSQADVSKIVQAFGYRPSHDLRAGLRETIRWYLPAPPR